MVERLQQATEGKACNRDALNGGDNRGDETTNALGLVGERELVGEAVGEPVDLGRTVLRAEFVGALDYLALVEGQPGFLLLLLRALQISLELASVATELPDELGVVFRGAELALLPGSTGRGHVSLPLTTEGLSNSVDGGEQAEDILGQGASGCDPRQRVSPIPRPELAQNFEVADGIAVSGRRGLELRTPLHRQLRLVQTLAEAGGEGTTEGLQRVLRVVRQRGQT